MKYARFLKAALVATLATASAPAFAQTKVTLMYTATAPFVSAFVAEDQGFFDKNGVDVELQLAANGSVIIAGVVSGSAQVGLPTPTVAFQAIENGLDLRAFASTNIFPDNTAAGLVVSTNSGIKTAKDLEGKKVGVAGLGGLLDVTMRKWATSNGADLSKINIVEVQLPQTADALRSGQVDAVASVDPFASRAVDTGAGTLIGNYFDIIPEGTAAGIYVTTAEWAEANAEAVKGMQLALDEALEYIKSNEASARDSIAKYTTLPPPVVAKMAMANLSTQLQPEKSLAFWEELAREQGLIQGDIDLETFVIKYPGE
jgi:NitT/TauT family transport system substrate-binding protein